MPQNNPTGKSVAREITSVIAGLPPWRKSSHPLARSALPPRTDIISVAAEVRRAPIQDLERQLVLKPGFACQLEEISHRIFRKLYTQPGIRLVVACFQLAGINDFTETMREGYGFQF